MRNMSFMLTTQQMRDCTKIVTRRLGWSRLKVGDTVMACVKCQGLGKGGKIEKIHPIRITRITREPLHYIVDFAVRREGRREVELEGFPLLTGYEFMTMFCQEMKCDWNTLVNRIEFVHLRDDGNGEVR